MRQLILALFLCVTIFFTSGQARAQSQNNSAGSIADAQVLSVKSTGKANQENHQPISTVRLKILSGKYAGKVFEYEDNAIALPYHISFKQGDRVIATISENGNNTQTVYISDYDRRPQLLALFILFLVVTIAIARKQAVTSFLGMLISIYVIAQIIMPSIVSGTNAFTITLIGSLVIIPATYYPAHGFNKKTTIAVAGTVLTLIITAVLSYVFVYWTKLTGFANEEATFIQNTFGNSVNILGLLLAGMLIGALAVLNDITISQASVVASLRQSNNRLTKRQLYKHAMDVGKDHVASLINTLILVYVGAAFPLVLLFYNTHTSASLILNQEIIATELVRTFVASIGIVLAVPVTTYLACLWE